MIRIEKAFDSLVYSDCVNALWFYGYSLIMIFMQPLSTCA